MDVKWKKAAIFNSIVSHILDVETENPGSPFAARELNSMYVEVSNTWDTRNGQHNTFYKKVSKTFT